jgi:DNA-binding transcriptional regulator YiaG
MREGAAGTDLLKVVHLTYDYDSYATEMRRIEHLEVGNVSTVLDSIADLSQPSAAAVEIQRLNDRLAAEPTIPAAIVDTVRELAAGVDQTNLRRWEAIDPHHAVIVLHSAVSAQRAIEEPDAPAARDQLRVALESIRQSLAAIAEREPVGDERNPKQIVQWLAERTEVSQATLADLLGVSARQLQRWLSAVEAAQPEGEDARKVRLVARLVNQLRFVLTPAGTVDWFSWPRTDLDRQRPRDLLDDPAAEPTLAMIAGAMRSQLAD